MTSWERLGVEHIPLIVPYNRGMLLIPTIAITYFPGGGGVRNLGDGEQ